MSVMTPEQSTFEAETCGRCGGSGNYSFNQIDGTRCYGCGGSGIKLTKRGAAARAFYRDSQMMPIADPIRPPTITETRAIINETREPLTTLESRS